jgi:hypothetical protein
MEKTVKKNIDLLKKSNEEKKESMKECEKL